MLRPGSPIRPNNINLCKPPAESIDGDPGTGENVPVLVLLRRDTRRRSKLIRKTRADISIDTSAETGEWRIIHREFIPQLLIPIAPRGFGTVGKRMADALINQATSPTAR